MALVVNTNVASITSQMYVNQTNKDMGDTMARLSSGKRINTAADDAAGVAIASRLSSEIRGTNQAVRNALDAQGLINTAEGAHKEIETILQRMRELAVQSANDTNDSTDRTNLDAEMQQLVEEIDRIAGVTTWAGLNLLDGASFDFQIGGRTNSEDTLAVSINAVKAENLGLSGAQAVSASSSLSGSSFVAGFDSEAGTLRIETAAKGQAEIVAQDATDPVSEVQKLAAPTVTNGAFYHLKDSNGLTVSSMTAGEGATLQDIAQGLTVEDGVQVASDGTDLSITFPGSNDEGEYTLEIGGGVVQTATANGETAETIAINTENPDGIDFNTGDSKGFTLEVTTSGETVSLVVADGTYDSASLTSALKGADGYSGSAFTIDESDGTITITFSDTDGPNTVTLTETPTHIITASEEVKGTAGQIAAPGQGAITSETVSISVGSQTFDIELDISSTSGEADEQATQIAALLNSDSSFSAQFTAEAVGDTITFTGLSSGAFNVTNRENAQAAIITIDAAISTVNTQRANLGAYSNRLDNTVSNLSNIAINLEDGRSRIEDADFAAESASLAKNQILLQAGTAMLAQANASQQNVLSLLG